MVASLSSFKDHDAFLKAASIVREKLNKVCFLLVGDGENRHALCQTIDKLDLQESVVLTGYRMDMENIYPLLDVSVLMTNANMILEGISNTVLESMAMRIPVIASRGGGTDEIIEHEKTGLLVEPGNAEQLADFIIELLSNKEKALFISANGQRNVFERFSNDKYVENTTRIYKELLFS